MFHDVYIDIEVAKGLPYVKVSSYQEFEETLKPHIRVNNYIGIHLDKNEDSFIVYLDDLSIIGECSWSDKKFDEIIQFINKNKLLFILVWNDVIFPSGLQYILNHGIESYLEKYKNSIPLQDYILLKEIKCLI